VDDQITPLATFVLGIAGTLLVEWRFKPRFERRRRREARWESEVQQLLELLEVRLPRLVERLNSTLRAPEITAEIERTEDLTPAQRDALQAMLDADRETAQRAYEAREEVAQTAAVLTRRVARFHRPEGLTVYEVRSQLYSMLYVGEVSKFRSGQIPSGEYRERERTLREELRGWAERQLREGRPAGRQWLRWLRRGKRRRSVATVGRPEVQPRHESDGSSSPPSNNGSA